MAQNYMRHYPEIQEHLDRYMVINETVWENSKVITRPEDETFYAAVSVAIGGGCFILTPTIAMYLMRVDIALYIKVMAGYLTSPNIDPSRLHLSNCLISSFLVSVGRDLCRHDHFTYVRGILDDLPIHHVYKDDIWNMVETTIYNNLVPPRYLH